MTEKFDDGGPAFPNIMEIKQSPDGCDGAWPEIIGGATLWDYFAAHALLGLVNNPDSKISFDVQNAAMIADAMIAERKKRMGDKE